MFDDILGAVGGLIGGLKSQDDRNSAQNQWTQYRQQFQNLNPNIQAQEATSNYRDVDPATRQAQMDAMGQMRGIYTAGLGGRLDPAAQAQLTNSQIQVGQQVGAQQQGALQDANRRGMLNSGQTLGAQMLAAQGGQLASGQNALGAAAMAQQNGQNALGAYGQMAGMTRGQDLQGEAQRAQAMDAISRFNAGQRQGAQQDTFGNAYARAGGEGQGYAGAAGQYNTNADETQRLWSGIGTGLGAGVDAAGEASGILPPGTSKKKKP